MGIPRAVQNGRGKWVLITESGLDDGYCGSHLAQDASGGLYRLRFPTRRKGSVSARSNPSGPCRGRCPGAWSSSATRRAAFSNPIVNDPRTTSLTATDWIKPGRAAWSWWSKSDSPKHAEDLNAFTDLAAEMGWEYALVDANWNAMQSGKIEDVIAHAKAKNVGLLFWYNSGGPHNDVTEAPRDRMFDRNTRRKEFEKLKAWGVKGVKSISGTATSRTASGNTATSCATRPTSVNGQLPWLHIRARGWSREFNLVGMEAVFSAEVSSGGYARRRRGWHGAALHPQRRGADGLHAGDVQRRKYPPDDQPRTSWRCRSSSRTDQHFADSVESPRVPGARRS
jgi:hypothetical protein